MIPSDCDASLDLGVSSEISKSASELPLTEADVKVCQRCGKPLSWFVCGGFNYCCECDGNHDN